MYKLPIIKVKDKSTNQIHIVGSDSHDQLYINENGTISYYNLQNGEGTGGDYEFVGVDNEYEEGLIEMEDITKDNPIIKELSNKLEELEKLYYKVLFENIELKKNKANNL